MNLKYTSSVTIIYIGGVMNILSSSNVLRENVKPSKLGVNIQPDV